MARNIQTRLTPSQMGIYVECLNHPDGLLYHIPRVFEMDQTVNAELLCRAMERVIHAHPSLFTRIGQDDSGYTIQYIEEEALSLIVEPLESKDFAPYLTPFKLQGGRLFHVHILQDDEHVYLFWDCHHLINDGTSLQQILHEVEKAYQGEAIEPEAYTMLDAADAENQVSADIYEKDKAWYTQTFGCDDVSSRILPDREEGQPGHMAHRLNVNLVEVEAFCSEHGIYKSTLMTTAYAFLLARYNHEEQSLFKTVYKGRTDQRFLRTQGMFVKTLPCYCCFTHDTSCLELLFQQQEQMKGCREHHTYPWMDMVHDLHLETDTSFVWHGNLFNDTTFAGKPMTAHQLCDERSDDPLFLKVYVQEGEIYIYAEYDGCYSDTLVKFLISSYEMVLQGLMKKEKLCDISLCDVHQQNLLDSFNETDSPYDDTQTVVSLFRHQAQKHSTDIALVFKDKSFTYAEVDEMSDRIAAHIAAKGLGREDVVSVIIPRSEWMAIASLGVLKAGCAYQPLDPTYPKERLNLMLSDSGARLLIADELLLTLLDTYQGEVLLTKDIEQLPPAVTLPEGPLPSSLFTLIYTSGSTGVPKGGMTEHRNWVAFLHMNNNRYHITEKSRIAAYASFGFDASPQEMFEALCAGAQLHIIPEEMRLDLVALNDYFERNEITHTFMTTQVAYQFATSIENHSLEYLLTGGEKLGTLDPPKGYTLTNCYGPSETICYVTNYPIKRRQKNIPIGKAVENVKLYVVDSHGHRQPVGACGELWIATPQVGRGYLNRPEKTAEVFTENPFCDDAKYRKLYKSGDIVRYLPDGNIEFVGRRDGQVKIRGFRIELKEVEAIIRLFPGIKDVTVQAFEEPGSGKHIAAYVVGDGPIDMAALNAFIQEEKPPYMVPAVTMQIDSIPLNQNQKVDKKALPKPVKSAATKSGSTESVPPNILEQDLKAIVADIVKADDFGITDVLGYVGLTSISAIQLATRVYKKYGVSLDVKSLVKSGSIQSIENEILALLLSPSAEKINSSKPQGSYLLQEEDREVTAPLSYSQTGVYVECMKAPTSTLYNIPSLTTFPADTDIEALCRALETVIKAHPQFRVHFGSRNTEVVQTIDPSQPINIVCHDMDDEALQHYKHDFVQPFNLKRGPLYRMEIVRTPQHVFLLSDVHHLIFDGSSFDLFLRQLCDLMEGRSIEPEQLSFANFVAEQSDAEKSDAYTAARDFFNVQLKDCEGATEVQSDLTNPTAIGTTEEVVWPLPFAEMDAFCRQYGLTPAHLTLAAVMYTLGRFTNNDSLCITTISGGRSDLRIASTIGMFVNTLPLTATIAEQSVADFLQEMSARFDATLRHEHYPFAQLAADYNLKADIMFAYQVGVIDTYTCLGHSLGIETLESDAPKFRMAFYIKDEGVCIDYDNGQYSNGLMQSIAQSVANAVGAFMRQPQMPLQKVSLLGEQQEELLDSFNQTDVAYDNSQDIVSLFCRQAATTPDNVAVVYHDKQFTYREVDQLSDRLAGYIASKGLGRGDVVSILIPRSEWMVIASLGVLKAGCAYQPLDPTYPEERLEFMRQDAKSKLLFTEDNLLSIVQRADTATNLKPYEPHPEDLFILLYTSGSTGVPKGVMLEHRNLVAFCHWYQRVFHLTAECKVAAYASYGFDACMMDIYPAITCGASVHIIGNDIRLNLPDLNNYFNHNGITHSFITTQVGYQFATNTENHSLRYLAVGGEKLSSLQPPADYQMVNGYGPTECTIFTTTYLLREYQSDIPIGKPLDNLRLYIVDKQMNRLPLGAAGELLVSGPQVGRGYLNRPEATAAAFVDNPFVKDGGQTVNGSLPNSAFSRCYRTGDIVRYLPDGNIQFVGRQDGQVKIRGFRIELKEIETVIRQYPGIKDVTVQAFDYSNGGKYIAAYIVSDEQIDTKALNAFIGKQKPPYMVPTATMQIESIPLNQNQKVNRKALPAPVIQVTNNMYVEPVGEVEKLFCNIFAGILSAERIGATDNFFELGGTSIMVTRVIIEADRAGHHIGYGDIFANPSPRQIAAFLNKATASDGSSSLSKDNSDAAYDYTPIHDLLRGNTLKAFRESQSRPIGSVLLTGATGYLGIHVLKELIGRSDVPEIWCLVRAESTDKATRRLKGLLFYYFNEKFDTLFGTRIHVVPGDVTAMENLGVGHIDSLFNCAAVVKHFSAGNEIEDVNVGGAINCIHFCKATGARLIHVSTYSTAGLSIDGHPSPGTIQTEQMLYYGQSMDNRYVHSKFVAERAILEAVAIHGLDAKVMRVGNLAPRSTDGEFQINAQTNSAMGRVRVFRTLGCYPYEQTDQSMEFSPINEVARAIVLLSETPRECCLFHPFNNHSVHFGDVMHELRVIGAAPRQVESEEFQAILEQAKGNPDKARILQSLLAYQDMGHGHQAHPIPSDNTYTSQVLYRMGFRWSTTSWDYVDRFLFAINGLGFFDS